MDINEAAKVVEAFLTTYFGDAAVVPQSVQVHPSGDVKDEIKIWFNFGPKAQDLDVQSITNLAIGALREAHADIAADYTLHVRSTATE